VDSKPKKYKNQQPSKTKMPKSFGSAHGQPDGEALNTQQEGTLAAMSSQTHSKNVPVHPPWPELQSQPATSSRSC